MKILKTFKRVGNLVDVITNLEGLQIFKSVEVSECFGIDVLLSFFPDLIDDISF